MKTQIIQLHQDDDYLSVRDKMSWSQTGRILLVWPVEGRVLTRQFDLNLINRYACSIGAQLALVTHNANVRYYARKMGVSVFGNTHRALDQPWKDRRSTKLELKRNSQRQNLYEMRKIIHPPAPAWVGHFTVRFLCLLMSMLGLLLLGIFIIPSARIILFPRIQTQTIRFDLSTDPSSNTNNRLSGILPSYNQEVVVEGHDTIPATGSMIFPDEIATSDLKFTNITTQVINLPAGIIISTLGGDPIRYITVSSDDVTISPKKSVFILARAIKPGSSENLPPNKLVALEGDLNLDLKVTNPNATQGGTVATVPTPTGHDLQILHDRLQNHLKQIALTEMQLIIPRDAILISPAMSIAETIEETYFPPIGEPGNQLELTLRLRFQAKVVSGDVLHRLVSSVLDANTPVGYSPISNSLEITPLSQPFVGKDGIYHWTILANRKLQADIPAYLVINLVKGATVSSAKDRLSASLPLMEQTQIILIPKWWPRLPFLTMRMNVTQAENP